MKYLQLMTLASLLFFVSCKKDNDPKGESNEIVGRWKIERKVEAWGVGATPEEKGVDCEWVEFRSNGEFIEKFSGNYQIASKWKLLESGNLEITASTNIPGAGDGLVIKSISDKEMHLYCKDLYGSFYTEVTYNLYLVRL